MSYHSERKGEGAGAIAARSRPHRSARAPIVSATQGMQYAIGDDLGQGVVCWNGTVASIPAYCPPQPSGPGRPLMGGPRPTVQRPKIKGVGSGGGGGSTTPGGTSGGYSTSKGTFGGKVGPAPGSSGTPGGAPGGETSTTPASSSSITATSVPPQVLTGGLTSPDGSSTTVQDLGPAWTEYDLTYIDSMLGPDTSSPAGPLPSPALTPVQQTVGVPSSTKFPWLLIGGGIALLYLLSRK